MKSLSIVYFGSPEIAVPPLSSLLIDHCFQIKSVITQPDKKSGRGQKKASTPVKNFALSNKLIVQDEDEIKKIEHSLLQENPDFLVVCAYGKILPKSLLEIPKFGAVNIHFSLLPKYRGASPIQEALLNREIVTGVTFMRMNERLDEGDIYLQESIEIENEDNALSLSQKLSLLSSKLLPKLLVDIASGKILPHPQDHQKASYCRRIKKEDGEIHPQRETAEEIMNKIRAYTPWPGTFVILKGKRVKILYANSSHDEQKISSGKWLIEGKNLYLGTKNGALEIEEVQPEGKKPMRAAEFIAGYRSLISE